MKKIKVELTQKEAYLYLCSMVGLEYNKGGEEGVFSFMIDDRNLKIFNSLDSDLKHAFHEVIRGFKKYIDSDSGKVFRNSVEKFISEYLNE